MLVVMETGEDRGRVYWFMKGECYHQDQADYVPLCIRDYFNKFFINYAEKENKSDDIKAFADKFAADVGTRAEAIFELLIYAYNNLLFIKPQGNDIAKIAGISKMIGELSRIFYSDKNSKAIIAQVIERTFFYGLPEMLGVASGPETLLPLLKNHIECCEKTILRQDENIDRRQSITTLINLISAVEPEMTQQQEPLDYDRLFLPVANAKALRLSPVSVCQYSGQKEKDTAMALPVKCAESVLDDDQSATGNDTDVEQTVTNMRDTAEACAIFALAS